MGHLSYGFVKSPLLSDLVVLVLAHGVGSSGGGVESGCIYLFHSRLSI